MKKVSIVRSDGRHYDSITSAAHDVGGQESHISECIRDIEHRHTHKGWRWRYDTMGKTKD